MLTADGLFCTDEAQTTANSKTSRPNITAICSIDITPDLRCCHPSNECMRDGRCVTATCPRPSPAAAGAGNERDTGTWTWHRPRTTRTNRLQCCFVLHFALHLHYPVLATSVPFWEQPSTLQPFPFVHALSCTRSCLLTCLSIVPRFSSPCNA